MRGNKVRSFHVTGPRDPLSRPPAVLLQASLSIDRFSRQMQDTVGDFLRRLNAMPVPDSLQGLELLDLTAKAFIDRLTTIHGRGLVFFTGEDEYRALDLGKSWILHVDNDFAM